MLNELGSRETLAGKEKLYELIPESRFEKHVALPAALPVTVSPGQTAILEQYIADDVESSEAGNGFQSAVIRLVTENAVERDDVKSGINGHDLERGSAAADSCLFGGPHVIAPADINHMLDIGVPPAFLRHGENSLSFSNIGTDSITIKEIQIALR